MASHKGHLEVVRLLLDAKADKDKATDADAHGVTPMYVASHQAHLEVVRLFLEANADKDKATDALGETPMFAASHQAHLEVCSLVAGGQCRQG